MAPGGTLADDRPVQLSRGSQEVMAKATSPRGHIWHRGVGIVFLASALALALSSMPRAASSLFVNTSNVIVVQTSMRLEPMPGRSLIELEGYGSLPAEEYGQLLKAEALLKKGLLLDSRNERLYLSLGRVYSTIRNYEAAQYMLERALELNVGDALGHCMLASVYWRNAEFGKAGDEWALAGVRDDVIAQGKQLFAQLSVAGRFEEAIRYGEALVGLEPHSPEMQYALAGLYWRQGAWTEAERALERAIELDASISAQRLFAQARLRILHKQWSEAAVLLRAALELDSTDALVHRFLGIAYMHVGDLDAAMVEIRTALRISPNDLWSLIALGDLYRLQGQNEAAAIYYRRALTIDPANDMARDALESLNE